MRSVDISWVVGAAVTAVVYLLLARGIDATGEQAAIERSERELRQAGSVAGA